MGTVTFAVSTDGSAYTPLWTKSGQQMGGNTMPWQQATVVFYEVKIRLVECATLTALRATPPSLPLSFPLHPTSYQNFLKRLDLVSPFRRCLFCFVGLA